MLNQQLRWTDISDGLFRILMEKVNSASKVSPEDGLLFIKNWNFPVCFWLYFSTLQNDQMVEPFVNVVGSFKSL